MVIRIVPAGMQTTIALPSCTKASTAPKHAASRISSELSVTPAWAMKSAFQS